MHPITQLINRTAEIFAELGFTSVAGPELETGFYNFDALNVPEEHPARDMQDTFWLATRIDADKTRMHADKNQRPSASDPHTSALLRTHTSPMQIRYMEKYPPPLRVIVPGKVYRNEATDATHEAQFYQVEGLYVDKKVSLANLKGVLEHYFSNLLGSDIDINFRPSFFPFTEPSVEVFISCFKCGKDGCNVCKQTGWIEVMGAGMVHPEVLKSAKLDPNEWQGFAFGGAIDRLAMLKWGIDDIRLLHGGDIRFLKQFSI